MSTDNPCASRSYQLDQLVQCTMVEGHWPAVHLGRAQLEGDVQELVQWADADAISDTEGVSELPLWYGVLPLGEHVQVDLKEHPTLDKVVGELTGVVVGENDGEPQALRLARQQNEGIELRVFVPWHNVAAIAYEVEL